MDREEVVDCEFRAEAVLEAVLYDKEGPVCSNNDVDRGVSLPEDTLAHAAVAAAEGANTVPDANVDDDDDDELGRRKVASFLLDAPISDAEDNEVVAEVGVDVAAAAAEGNRCCNVSSLGDVATTVDTYPAPSLLSSIRLGINTSCTYW